MSGAIIVVDSSAVREGKVGELKALITELVGFVESHESRPIVYGMYLNAEETVMTVAQVHPDSAAMEFHMKAAGPIFARFAELITLLRIDVYGTPSEDLRDQLRRKARVLGAAVMVEHEIQAGLVRLGQPA